MLSFTFKGRGDGKVILRLSQNLRTLLLIAEEGLKLDMQNHTGCLKKASHFQMQITPEIFSLKIQFGYF